MSKAQIHVCRAVVLSLVMLGAGNVAASPSASASSAKAGATAQQAFFAKIGDVTITHDEYNAAFSAAARGKFYHGKPPEGEIAALQREVGDQLVTRILLLREARQRGLVPDASEIQKTLEGYEQRYAGNERWEMNRDKLLPAVKARLEEENLLAQLEKIVRNVPRPAQKEVRAYYTANPDKFTEPEQLRVSVILLKVDPGAPGESWVKADEEIRKLIKKLESGADFEALAREHSADDSKKQGGDLGYLHKGMLPNGTESVLAALKVGEISNSVQLLEGVAIFRVTDRKVAKLNSFEKVESRAADLLHRDQSDQAWNKLAAELKKKTPVQIDQSRFLPLAEQSEARQAPK